MVDLTSPPRPRPSRRRQLALGVGIGALALVVAVGAALLGGALAADETRPEPGVGVVELVPDGERNPLLRPEPQGDRVPDGVFQRLDGGTGSFADYAGRPLVVNFFAEWCVPCVKEMPEFEQVHRRVGDRVAFLGLDVQDSVEKGVEIVERTGVTYDVARDPIGSLLAHFGGVAMPTTAFVDADGRIVDVVSGALSAEELEAHLTDAFGVEVAP